MTTIGIWGGTGYAGAHIASEAAKRGFEVTAVARKTPEEPIDGVTYVEGAINDVAFVDKLAADNDVVVVAIAPSKQVPSALPALMATARAHGTRLGFMGGAGSSLVAPGGPRLIDTPDFHEAWKAEAQALVDVLATLRADTSSLDWFVVSPPALFGRFAPGETTGKYRIGGDVLVVKDDGMSEISGTDFALAFVDEIAKPTHRRERFTVGH